MSGVRNACDPYVQFATSAIRLWVQEKSRLTWPMYAAQTHATPAFTRAMNGAATGVFVTLRGCMGTIEPCQATLAHELAANAISASSQDPRFAPVTAHELDTLCVGVDVLGVPRLYTGPIQWDVRQYGVVVNGQGRRGLLLPDLDGVDNAQTQVAIAADKAGLTAAAVEQIWLFTIARHI